MNNNKFELAFMAFLTSVRPVAQHGTPVTMSLLDFETHLTDLDNFDLPNLRALYGGGPAGDLFWQNLVDAFVILTIELDMKAEVVYSTQRLLACYYLAEMSVISHYLIAGRYMPVNKTDKTAMMVYESKLHAHTPTFKDVFAHLGEVKAKFEQIDHEILMSMNSNPFPQLHRSQDEITPQKSAIDRTNNVFGLKPIFDITPEQMEVAAEKVRLKSVHHWDTTEKISDHDFKKLIIDKKNFEDQPVLNKLIAYRYSLNDESFDRFWRAVISQLDAINSSNYYLGSDMTNLPNPPEPDYFGQRVEMLEYAMVKTEELWTTLRRDIPMRPNMTPRIYADATYQPLAFKLYDLEVAYAEQTGTKPRYYPHLGEKKPDLQESSDKSLKDEIVEGVKKAAAIVDDMDQSLDEIMNDADKLGEHFGNVIGSLLHNGAIMGFQTLFYGAPKLMGEVAEKKLAAIEPGEPSFLEDPICYEILTKIKEPGLVALYLGLAQNLIDRIERLPTISGQANFRIEMSLAEEPEQRWSYHSQGMFRDALEKIYQSTVGSEQWTKSEEHDGAKYMWICLPAGEETPPLSFIMYNFVK